MAKVVNLSKRIYAKTNYRRYAFRRWIKAFKEKFWRNPNLIEIEVWGKAFNTGWKSYRTCLKKHNEVNVNG